MIFIAEILDCFFLIGDGQLASKVKVLEMKLNEILSQNQIPTFKIYLIFRLLVQLIILDSTKNNTKVKWKKSPFIVISYPVNNVACYNASKHTIASYYAM